MCAMLCWCRGIFIEKLHLYDHHFSIKMAGTYGTRQAESRCEVYFYCLVSHGFIHQ